MLPNSLTGVDPALWCGQDLVQQQPDRRADLGDAHGNRQRARRGQPPRISRQMATSRQVAKRAKSPDAATTPPCRRVAIEQTAGALTGVYEPGELATLRDGWPA